MKFARALSSFALLTAVAACSSSSPEAGSDAGGGGASASDGGGTPNAGSDSGSLDSGSVIPPTNDAGGGQTGGADAGGSKADAGGGAVDAGGTDLDSGAGPVSPTDVKVQITIPSTFTGTPRELDLVLAKSLPIASIPTSLYQQKNPTITPGETLTIHGDDTGINGGYYVVAVLYMVGGGTFTAKVGVDYEGRAPALVTFNASAIDLGTIPLGLAVADGGI